MYGRLDHNYMVQCGSKRHLLAQKTTVHLNCWPTNLYFESWLRINYLDYRSYDCYRLPWRYSVLICLNCITYTIHITQQHTNAAYSRPKVHGSVISSMTIHRIHKILFRSKNVRMESTQEH